MEETHVVNKCDTKSNGGVDIARKQINEISIIHFHICI